MKIMNLKYSDDNEERRCQQSNEQIFSLVNLQSNIHLSEIATK